MPGTTRCFSRTSRPGKRARTTSKTPGRQGGRDQINGRSFVGIGRLFRGAASRPERPGGHELPSVPVIIPRVIVAAVVVRRRSGSIVHGRRRGRIIHLRGRRVVDRRGRRKKLVMRLPVLVLVDRARTEHHKKGTGQKALHYLPPIECSGQTGPEFPARAWSPEFQ